jgi:hypothetical protein
MSTATIPAELLGRPLSPWQRILLYVSVTALVGLALWVVLEHPYTPGSRLGYDLGLAGGCMMLALLLYPLRKHWSRLHNAGSLRAWFIVHLVFGICGPLLVVFHSGFRLHSFNASVAFWCMVVVALSGGMGRYIYLHVYRRLALLNATLWQLEGTMEAHDERGVPPLDLAPKAKEWLAEYRRHPFARRSGLLEKLGHAFARNGRGERLARPARAQAASALERHARRERWSAGRLAAERQALDKLITGYVRTIDSVVRQSVWERIFRLWHLAHVPFVYILVISAVAHVVAVHVY